MKSTITWILVLLTVACTGARNVNYPASLPDISSPSLPSQQWNTQDEIGQASFGYSYPGQAASNVLDSAGKMSGSWAYVNPEGKVVNVSYVADERGFRVSSNVLPASVAPVLADLAVDPVKTVPNPAAKAVPAPTDDDNCILNFPVRSKRQADEEIKPDATNYGTSIENEMGEPYPSFPTMGETGRNQYPFMAALLKYDETSRRYKLACGGSLISATKILTAAHCVIHDNKIPAFDKLLVKLGVHFLNETADDATLTMRINQVDIHENYDQETKFNNIAIVTLESPVKFTDRISTVCVPKACNQGAGNGYAQTLGWGNDKEGERNSDVLRQTDGDVGGKKWCTEHLRRFELADHMMCAHSERNLCQNYDGGPLIQQKRFKGKDCPWVQFGILIAASGCFGNGQPDVYTRLTSFSTWIDDKVNPLQ